MKKPRITAVILLVFAVQAHIRERALTGAHPEELDSTTFGKAGQLGTSASHTQHIANFRQHAFLLSGRPFRPLPKVRSALAIHASIDGDAAAELAPGINYLPALDFEQSEPFEPEAGVLVLPCWPVPTMTYLPGTQPVLTIFEPRYRQMYSDILMSGGRRFVATYGEKDKATGQVKLAEFGAVLYLKDLKEVSERTQDVIKYVCFHEVIGFVRLKRVLNPRAFADKSMYLRVEVEDSESNDTNMNTTILEHRVIGKLKEVTRLQREASPKLFLKEGNATSMESELDGLNATHGLAFWRVVKFWQQYLHVRANGLEQKYAKDVQDILMSYITSTSDGDTNPKRILLDSLPEQLQNKIAKIKESLQDDLNALAEQQTRRVQELIQTASHSRRLMMFEAMVQSEERRLRAQLALMSLFKKGDSE